jgi:hypothetical protein
MANSQIHHQEHRQIQQKWNSEMELNWIESLNYWLFRVISQISTESHKSQQIKLSNFSDSAHLTQKNNIKKPKQN